MELINKDIAMEYLMGNEIIYNKIKDSFLASYQNYKNIYQEFKEREKIEEAYNYIHSIKGISLNLGAEVLYRYASKALEILKKEQWRNDVIDQFFIALELTYNELKFL